MMMQNEKGFSLVELAISIIVIGVLIAGVVKGQEIIESARATNTISQVRAFTTAISSFQSAYGSYPGDLRDVALLDCGTLCVGGNGDNRIVIGGSATQTGTTNPAWTLAASANDEAVQFWKHLAVAEMVSDVNVGATVTTTSDFGIGLTHPGSRLGGAYDVLFDTNFQPDSVTTGVQGHFLRLSNGAIFGTSHSSGDPWEHTIKPALAFIVDRKMDDGYPYTGSVFAAGDDCVSGDTLTAEYDRAEPEESCVMFFKFGGRRG